MLLLCKALCSRSASSPVVAVLVVAASARLAKAVNDEEMECAEIDGDAAARLLLRLVGVLTTPAIENSARGSISAWHSNHDWRLR